MSTNALSNSSSSSCAKRNPPPLSELCQQVISCKIERYPPEAFAGLSPDEWDRIIQQRYRTTAPQKHKGPTAANGGGLDTSGRMIPALNSESLKVIENCNPHLATSEVADTLVWKDCVEYSFASKSEYIRPKALFLPWPLLVEKLKHTGQDILQCWTDCSENGEPDLASWRLRTQAALVTLHEAPMSVELLTSTEIGKLVSKLVKAMSTRKHQIQSKKVTQQHNMMEWLLFESTESSSTPSCLLTQLQCLLNSWKGLASASGIKMKVCGMISHSQPSANGAVGSGKRTTEEQHRKDMAALINCNSWRELYAVLELRRDTMKSEMGAHLRKSRESINTDRLKTKTCVVAKSEKLETILGSSVRGTRSIVRGTRSIAMATSGTKSTVSLGPTKLSAIAALKKKTKNDFARTMGENKVSSIGFGCSIANSSTRKRLTSGSIAHASGKKMKLPTNGMLNAAKKGIESAKPKISTNSRGAFMKR